MQKRASGVELCRIFAMLLIVAGHFIGQSGLGLAHVDSLWLRLCGSGSRWAVNLFLVVACWFMVDSKFKAERIVKLYLTVLFYAVPLTILAFVLGNPTSKDVCRGFLPILGRPLWFISAYISLALVAPWLRFAFMLNRKSLGLLVVLLTVFISVVCTLPDPQMCYTVDVCYFFYVFILVGFLKPIFSSSGKYKYFALLMGIALYLMLVLLRQKGSSFMQEWAGQCLSDFKTLPNLISSLLVFYFFLHVNIGSIKLINVIASSALAVYIIHQTPAFYDFLWNNIFKVKMWMASDWYPLYTLGVVIAVYLSGLLLEVPRRLIVDKWLISLAITRRGLRILDDVYSKIYPKIVS